MSELTSGDLRGIENRISALQKDMSLVNSNVQNVSNQISATHEEMIQLKADFERMINEQRRTATLQQASTELVTVRQEIEKMFGNYRTVRNTMIGILQATDAALVRKVTVSQVSEELMITTPNYWLAPVLVAISAWIGNDRDLANRAVCEAVKRDNEHTSLVMALICRRNNHIQACYEWLARYFSTQDAASFDEDGMVYINAYINGVFGTDEKHMCDDYITYWIDKIKESSNCFEEEQTETWRDYYNRFNVDESDKYPALKECVQEFGYIDQFLGRVDAVSKISAKFQEIQNADINKDELHKAVDEHLNALVSADDEAERDLREKEKYLQAVKACEGDIQEAKKIVEQEKVEKQKETMNIVQQMMSVVSEARNASPSEKKTAVSFLKGYLNKGFNQYIVEKKEMFPQQITLHIDGWLGQTVDGSNAKQLYDSYNEYLEKQKAQKKEELQKKNDPKKWIIITFVLVAIGLIAMGIAGVLGIAICWFFAIISFFNSYRVKKQGVKDLTNLDNTYERLSTEGKAKINDCLTQWNAATGIAKNLDVTKLQQIVA